MLRATRIGFVFQQFFLAEHADRARQRGRRPALRRRPRPNGGDAAMRRPRPWSASAARPAARPTQLSGGERQRVAIARALVGRAGHRAGRRAHRQPRPGHRRSRSWPCSRSSTTRGATIVVITHDTRHRRPHAPPDRDARRARRRRHSHRACRHQRVQPRSGQ